MELQHLLLGNRKPCEDTSTSGRTWLEGIDHDGSCSTTVRSRILTVAARSILILLCSFAGTLSYYRTQEDEGKASRGSISMAVAQVSPPGTDKLKFEVNNKLGKSFPSFFLRGNRAFVLHA